MKKLLILFSLILAATGFANGSSCFVHKDIIDKSRNRVIPLDDYEGNK
jgi:hypothetical protein